MSLRDKEAANGADAAKAGLGRRHRPTRVTHSSASLVSRELSRRFQVSLVWEGTLVGLFGGLVVTLYRFVLSRAEELMRRLTALAGASGVGVVLWFAFLAVICLVIGLLVIWEPDTSGSGIPQIDAEVMGAKSMRWTRTLVAKFAEGSLGALAGLSLGREGPSVMLGGMAGKGVSRALHRERGEERLLVTCGAGAGMAAAFHAPLTGVMFALEEIHKTFSAPLIISVMSSCVVADYVGSALLGIEPVVDFTLVEYLPHAVYALLVPFGIVLGLLGGLHNQGMFLAQDVLARLRQGAPFVRFAIPFAMTGVAAFVAPALLCGGDAILKLLAQPEGLTLGMLAALLVGKYLLTSICFGSGVPGGTLFPLVTMGALAGALVGGCVVPALGLDDGLLLNFMVLGIAGFFAGAIRAPVTAVVLAFELTGSLDALLSISIVSVVAYVTANLLRVDAYYEHLLGRLLGVSTEEAHTRWGATGKQLQSYVVEAGASLSGKRIQDISWPSRALVVTVSRAGVDLVAKGDVTLQDGDRLLVLLDEKLEQRAEGKLRELCRGRV